MLRGHSSGLGAPGGAEAGPGGCACFRLGSLSSGSAQGCSRALRSSSATRDSWNCCWEEEEGRAAPGSESWCSLEAYIKLFLILFINMSHNINQTFSPSHCYGTGQLDVIGWRDRVWWWHPRSLHPSAWGTPEEPGASCAASGEVACHNPSSSDGFRCLMVVPA